MWAWQFFLFGAVQEEQEEEVQRLLLSEGIVFQTLPEVPLAPSDHNGSAQMLLPNDRILCQFIHFAGGAVICESEAPKAASQICVECQEARGGGFTRVGLSLRPFCSSLLGQV